MSSILVAEDHVEIASFVEKGLRSAGYRTTITEDGRQAWALAATGAFDLVVLDVGLPGMDGFEVLRRLREDGHALPVIMLTARDGVHDTVAGLDGGANDYMTKPFQFAELLARVRLRLREGEAAAAPTGDAGTVVAGDLTLDLRRHVVTVGGRTHDLTAREFALLDTFVAHRDQVLSREQILGMVWDMDFDPGSNVVDVFVRALRGKIGAERILTVRGVGYRFRPVEPPG
ncbi:response regulator transcription factor [Janibacter alkaliphilus]|uniref:DNA-binding response OmpR family regulator n=1 Tax=Janibacter alkaliphilus TaxID=1069963 RepID=A0A852XIS4_9MICO|nr:response regulator transcription factor [Janibacter alkaliphilus]NYG38465.1 DNA-binding response OmpR family regulator [Janibacter alkaliphilus]